MVSCWLGLVNSKISTMEKKGNMKRIRVYYIGSRIKEIRSGGGKYLSEMLQGLERECDLEFCDHSVCQSSKEVRFGITTEAILYFMETNLWAISKLKRARRNDVILINSYYKQQFLLIPWVLKCSRDCKIVLSVNALYDYSRSSNFLNMVDRIVMKLFLFPADRVVANSKATKERLENLGVNSQKIKIVYPRLDLPPDLLDFARETNGVFHILFVGYCTPVKEVDVLIKAMGLLKDKAVHLHIVGETNRDLLYFDRLKNMVRQLGLEKKVVFHGRLEGVELSMQYKNAHIFVNASRREGYGRVFIEAMHFGLPVIGANEGGAKELIINGINGFLFQPGNAENLAEKILILHRDKNLREKMGKEGAKRSKLANFSRNLGEQFLQVIEELV